MKLEDILLLIQFLSGTAIAMIANDRRRADQIRDLSVAEIIELAKVEAAKAEQNANDLLSKK